MSARRPVCGNDPRAEITDGDRTAVEDFRHYLLARATAMDALPAALARANRTQWRVYCWDAEQWQPAGTACPDPDQAYAKLAALMRRHSGFIGRVVQESTAHTIDTQRRAEQR